MFEWFFFRILFIHRYSFADFVCFYVCNLNFTESNSPEYPCICRFRDTVLNRQNSWWKFVLWSQNWTTSISVFNIFLTLLLHLIYTNICEVFTSNVKWVWLLRSVEKLSCELDAIECFMSDVYSKMRHEQEKKGWKNWWTVLVHLVRDSFNWYEFFFCKFVLQWENYTFPLSIQTHGLQ